MTAKTATAAEITTTATENGWMVVDLLTTATTLMFTRRGHVLTITLLANGTVGRAVADIPGFRNVVVLPTPRRDSVELALTAPAPAPVDPTDPEAVRRERFNVAMAARKTDPTLVAAAARRKARLR